MSKRKLLMIPGPIEFDPTVMQQMSTPTPSHVAPGFISSYANVLNMMKEVWQAPTGQPFVVAGSGTLAMDMAACNMLEKGDNALVLSTGYFGERYVELLKRYGANVIVLKAETGNVVPLEMVRKELSSRNYKLITMTHVDTSTGVLVDPRPIAKLAKEFEVVSILDGVCSVAGEEIAQEEWGLDIVITASQKAIGVPPGLALCMVSKSAIDIWNRRSSPVANYYCDWSNWLPIMQAYEDGRPSYFATPPVNLIMALETSLRLILAEGMDNRIERHRSLAAKFREAMMQLGLGVIPCCDEVAANTLTAPYYPDGVEVSRFLSGVADAGVIVAGGLLPELKAKYFRVGHMGIVRSEDVDSTIGAIRTALGK